MSVYCCKHIFHYRLRLEILDTPSYSSVMNVRQYGTFKRLTWETSPYSQVSMECVYICIHLFTQKKPLQVQETTTNS
jgi:hypothetical protein